MSDETMREWITGDDLYEIMTTFGERADVSEIADRINAAINNRLSTRDEVGPVAGEGGEPFAWAYRYPNDPTWQITRDEQQARDKTGEVRPLYAAPPAPQLRIAVEALMGLPELERWQAQLSKGIGTATKDGKVVLAVLAALKSEGK